MGLKGSQLREEERVAGKELAMRTRCDPYSLSAGLKVGRQYFT